MRRGAAIAVLLLASAAAQPMQTALPPAPVTVVNTPYTAVYTAQVTRGPADSPMGENVVYVAHDSVGRTLDRTQRIRMLRPRDAGTPHRLPQTFQMYDPKTRLLATWEDPGNMVVEVQLGDPEDRWADARPIDQQRRKMLGFDVERRRIMYPPETGVLSEECWYSPDLHLGLDCLTERTSGETVHSVYTSLVRGEPDAALFRLPRGYDVVKKSTNAVAGEK